MQNSAGRITIPTDADFVEGTKRIAALWGADAVRDCDGTALPANPKEIADKVYQTYFVTRGDVEWAKNNPDELQHFFLSTSRTTATGSTCVVNLLDGYYAAQIKPDFSADSLKYWQVINRTTGKEHKKWQPCQESNSVIIKNSTPFCEYTVSYMAFNIWDSTQRYNYITNNWNCDKHSPYDPRYPRTKEHIKIALKKWLEQNPDINVIRFTTFLYHFFLVFNDKGKEKFVDWFGYNATVSPKALDDFQKEYGYRLTAEDFIDEGSCNNTHRVPKKAFLDYMEYTEQYVCKTVKELVDIVHSCGREAMMFLGDSWIGTEPYGEHFSSVGLDAVVGSVGSGTAVRMLSDMSGIRYTEGRFLPYFFPDTFFDGNETAAIDELNRNWLTARRALMRNPIDRIGFGGYLSLASRFTGFINRAAEICNEFRNIYDSVKGKQAHSTLTVGILNAWGKKRSWMCYMVAHELWYKQCYSYAGIMEALSGLPVNIEFISFDDIQNGVPAGIDVILNAGNAGTAWSGGEHWSNKKILTSIRKFIHGGGGFVGIGEPSAHYANGRFFQIADALGVEKELGFTLPEDKYNINKTEHFIFADAGETVDYGEGQKGIYALPDTMVLDIDLNDRFKRNVNIGEVRAAVNTYGKGRCFYAAGLPYNFCNARILYRALLWCAGKENELYQAFSTNPLTECNYYAVTGKYAIVNNSGKQQTTDFYDINGNKTSLSLKSGEILWL